MHVFAIFLVIFRILKLEWWLHVLQLVLWFQEKELSAYCRSVDHCVTA